MMKDRYIVMLLMSAVAPNAIAVYLYMLGLLGVMAGYDGVHIKKRLLTGPAFVLLSLIPGLIVGGVGGDGNILRIILFMMLVVLYPYEEFEINKKAVSMISILLMMWMIISQLGIAGGVSEFQVLRDKLYGYKGEVNLFIENGAPMKNGEVLSYRGGGLKHNPNDLASSIFLFFLVYEASKKDVDVSILKKVSLLLVVSLALFITKSRTYFLGFAVHIFLRYMYPFVKYLLFGRIKTKGAIVAFSGVVMIAAVTVIMWDRLAQLNEADSSADIKWRILSIYVKDALSHSEYSKLLFGGGRDVMFDSEYGHWIGQVGLIGLLGVFGFHFMVARRCGAFEYVIPVLTVGLGNTVLYGYKSGVTVLCLYLLLFEGTSKKGELKYSLAS